MADRSDLAFTWSTFIHDPHTFVYYAGTPVFLVRGKNSGTGLYETWMDYTAPRMVRSGYTDIGIVGKSYIGPD